MTTIAKRYPLFSKSDKVLWMLGDIFEKSEHKEVASIYYGNILKNYPLSDFGGECEGQVGGVQSAGGRSPILRQ